MFDTFKAMGAISALMKNKDKLADAAARVKRDLSAVRVMGEAGGGLVRVIASGEMRVVSMEISGALGSGLGASEQDRQMAAALIVEATNIALTRARDEAQRIVKREADALGLGELASGLGGEGPDGGLGTLLG